MLRRYTVIVSDIVLDKNEEVGSRIMQVKGLQPAEGYKNPKRRTRKSSNYQSAMSRTQHDPRKVPCRDN